MKKQDPYIQKVDLIKFDMFLKNERLDIRQALLSELRSKVEGLPTTSNMLSGDDEVDRGEVLQIITDLSKEEK